MRHSPDWHRQKPDDARARFELGMLLTLFGRDNSRKTYGTRAGHLLRMAVRGQPDNPWFIIGLAEYYVSASGRDNGVDRAFRLLDKAMSRLPDDPWLCLEKARLMATTVGVGEVDEVLSLYRRARDLDPSRGSSYFGTGRLLVVANRLDEARVHFERGLRIAPMDREAGAIREMLATMSTL